MTDERWPGMTVCSCALHKGAAAPNVIQMAMGIDQGVKWRLSPVTNSGHNPFAALHTRGIESEQAVIGFE